MITSHRSHTHSSHSTLKIFKWTFLKAKPGQVKALVTSLIILFMDINTSILLLCSSTIKWDAWHSWQLVGLFRQDASPAINHPCIYLSVLTLHSRTQGDGAILWCHWGEGKANCSTESHSQPRALLLLIVHIFWHDEYLERIIRKHRNTTTCLRSHRSWQVWCERSLKHACINRDTHASAHFQARYQFVRLYFQIDLNCPLLVTNPRISIVKCWGS